MNIKIIITIFFIGLLQSIFAYPITPRPLRKLVMESEFIVFAEVVGIEVVNSGDIWSDTKAILVVKDKIQGKIVDDTINVFFTARMTCPAPARYRKGKSVLAFLNKYKKNYSTHALSYGSKTIDTVSYKVYKSRIIEMQNILQIKNTNEKTEKILDWLVTCAIDTNTRWEGVYELSHGNDLMENYDNNKQSSINKYQLNETQQSKLRKAFFETNKLTYTDLNLISLIAKKNDTELCDFLTRKLKDSDVERMWYEEKLMMLIAEVTDRDDLKKIVKELENCNYKDKEKAKQLAKEFREKI